MKILMLADPASVHTLRWANAISDRGINVYIFGLSEYDGSLYRENIIIETLNTSLKIKFRPDGSILKVIYLKAVSRVRELIKVYQPDILHSHYASSFGLIGALAGFSPYIISVWGADIYNFPEKSLLHRGIIKYSLSKADRILSTSNVMAKRTGKFTNKIIEVTPFGIDIEKFRPIKSNSSDKDELVIGTIKTLEKKYGVEYLIRSFKLVKERLPEARLKLLIVGTGSLELKLKKLARDLDLESEITFTGFIKSDKIPEYHNMIDIYVAASTEDSESFGVAVLEASACGKPVIVSDAGGLPEVVENEITGLIVKKENPDVLADALEKLVINPELRRQMGERGRYKVLKEYNWEDSVDKMISIYDLIR